MAKLIIVTHEYDGFLQPAPNDSRRYASAYLLFDVLRHVRELGHKCGITSGLKVMPGDVALLHVDATIVPDDYLALGEHYPRTINFATGNISKRRISSLLLAKGDDWDAQVVVKANRNCRGDPEARHNRVAERLGRPLPHPGARLTGPYQVFDTIQAVDDGVWSDPDLVVERFLPEKDEEGYAIRTWVFMGDRERCTRTVNREWIVKAAGAIRYEPVPVPDELRAERERLKFDFGKFDFVVHQGKPILLDTNRTPGTARAIEQLMRSGARNLAEGLDGLLRRG